MEEGDAEGAHRPRRIALFVEPSPFAYISGYKNRFQNFIKHLREMGDEVIVVTTHQGVPREFHGAKLIGSWSFPCPWYRKVPLSLALSPRIISEVAKFKPDIIHASSPGIMVFGALVIAKLLSVPLVLSYHTHVPVAQLEKMFRGMPAVFTGMLHGEEPLAGVCKRGCLCDALKVRDTRPSRVGVHVVGGPSRGCSCRRDHRHNSRGPRGQDRVPLHPRRPRRLRRQDPTPPIIWRAQGGHGECCERGDGEV